jgi:hypothetical protein
VLRDKLRFQSDELKYKEANNDELLDRAHQQLEQVVQESKRMSDKQLEIIGEKERQNITLRDMLTTNEEKLGMAMRENLELHSMITHEREEYKKLEKNLRESKKAVEDILEKHSSLEEFIAASNDQQINSIKNVHEEKFKALLKELEMLSQDYDGQTSLLAYADRVLNSMLGLQLQSEVPFDEKVKRAFDEFERISRQKSAL